MNPVETSVYEVNPEVAPESRKLLVRFRLFSVVPVALSILAATLLAR